MKLNHHFRPHTPFAWSLALCFEPDPTKAKVLYDAKFAADAASIATLPASDLLATPAHLAADAASSVWSYSFHHRTEMAPLTSPARHGCLSCVRVADKISELEKRISSLYQIQAAENLMDTIIFGPAQPVSQMSESITRSPAVSEIGAASLDEPADIARHSAADAPPPAAAPDDTWARLRAKPKAAVSSTPAHPEHWVRKREKQPIRTCTPPF